MERRAFIRGSALVLATPGLLFLAGCPSVTQTTLAELIGEVGAGLQEILPFIKNVSASTAASIESAFMTLEMAVQSWKPGTTYTEITEAVNLFVADLGQLESVPGIGPFIATYQPLIALLVATVEGLIALLTNTPSPATMVSKTPGVSVRKQGTTIIVGYKGTEIKNPPRTAGDFRNAWNKATKADPQLAGLSIS